MSSPVNRHAVLAHFTRRPVHDMSLDSMLQLRSPQPALKGPRTSALQDEDIMEDDLGLRGQRPQPIDVQVGDQWGDIEYASSRWSDGEGYYRYELPPACAFSLFRAPTPPRPKVVLATTLRP